MSFQIFECTPSTERAVGIVTISFIIQEFVLFFFSKLINYLCPPKLNCYMSFTKFNLVQVEKYGAPSVNQTH